jgi:hypothetical protein
LNGLMIASIFFIEFLPYPPLKAVERRCSTPLHRLVGAANIRAKRDSGRTFRHAIRNVYNARD